uniref:Rubisco LSMT substrate-binding domain-containing protein n=2 Tax=Chrysotila carterae TaxID=13221 RepID=A0A7S4BVV8_CHRCT
MRRHVCPLQDGARRVREEVLQRRYGLQIGDQMKLLADRVPVETVEALAVMAASPKQLRKLAKVPTGTPLRLPSALEMLALENLVHACQVRLGGYAASLDADESALRASEPGTAKHNALLLRVYEQNVLETTLETALQRQAELGRPQPTKKNAKASDTSAAQHGDVASKAGLDAPAATGPANQSTLSASLPVAPEPALRAWDAARTCAWLGGVLANGSGAPPLSHGQQPVSAANTGADSAVNAAAARRAMPEPAGVDCAAWEVNGSALLRLAERGPLHACSALHRAGARTGCATRLWPLLLSTLTDNLAADCPPVRWAQTHSQVYLSFTLKGLQLDAAPRLRGQVLVLEYNSSQGERAVRLPLWSRPMPIRAADVHATSSQLKLSLRKREKVGAGLDENEAGPTRHLHDAGSSSDFDAETAAEVFAAEAAETGGDGGTNRDDDGDGDSSAASWPRLLLLRSTDRQLRRRGVLSADWEALAHVVASEEESLKQTERARQNVRWLEDKWARQGRGTLADVITSGPELSAEQVQGLGNQFGAAPPSMAHHHRGSSMSGRIEEALTLEQQRLLHAGVHPSQIPGLEDGVEVELGADNKIKFVGKEEL